MNRTCSGSDGNSYTTIQAAHDVANADDIIYVRAGTYNITTDIRFSRNGSSGHLITLSNYTGESPVIDATGWTASGGWGGLSFNGCSYWLVQGLKVQKCPGAGVYATNASFITVTRCEFAWNVRSEAYGGTNIAGTTNNFIFDKCDFHHTGQDQTTGTSGDGIGFGSSGVGNIIRYCRVWRNFDDGIDMWGASNILIQDTWCWENGYNDSLAKTTGNGQGVKLGGGGGDGNNTVRNCLLWNNGEDGINNNSVVNVCYMYNNTVWTDTAFIRGGFYNYNMYDTVAHVLRNNASLGGNGVSLSAQTVQDHNTWNGGVTCNTADFVSTDYTANTGARKSDGSLPDSNFLKLVGGSDLIDAGVDVGLGYNGSAPDMGAYEYSPAALAAFLTLTRIYKSP